MYEYLGQALALAAGLLGLWIIVGLYWPRLNQLTRQDSPTERMSNLTVGILLLGGAICYFLPFPNAPVTGSVLAGVGVLILALGSGQ